MAVRDRGVREGVSGKISAGVRRGSASVPRASSGPLRGQIEQKTEEGRSLSVHFCLQTSAL